jgi:hypothetical protein
MCGGGAGHGSKARQDGIGTYFLKDANDRFLDFVLLERGGHFRRVCTTSFVVSLIAFLLYETQWLNLRAGLVVLLIGYLGDVLALLLRNGQLSKDLDRTKMAEAMNEAAYTAWFERDEVFVKRLAVFDTACQMIGFLTLGYAFWVSTRSLWISLAIGFVYPVTAYFGMTRRKSLEAIKQIRATKQEVLLLNNGGG